MPRARAKASKPSHSSSATSKKERKNPRARVLAPVGKESHSDPSLPPSPSPPKPKLAQASAPAPAPTPLPAPKSLDPIVLARHCPVEDACTPKSRFTAYFDPCDWFDVEDDGDNEAKVDNARKDDRFRDVRTYLTAPMEGFGWEGLMIRMRVELDGGGTAAADDDDGATGKDLVGGILAVGSEEERREFKPVADVVIIEGAGGDGAKLSKAIEVTTNVEEGVVGEELTEGAPGVGRMERGRKRREAGSRRANGGIIYFIFLKK